MNLNQKLILGLSFGCVILNTLTDTTQKSNYNTSSSVQSALTVNGGSQNKSSETIPNTSLTRALEQNGKVSKTSSSSVSNSKIDISTAQPGNKIRYFPNENPGDSGSGNSGPETGEWETKASCPNLDEIISNVDFWNYYLDSKDCCPNVDVELDEDDDWSFKDIVEIPEDQKRRRLLATQPTAKLDKGVKSQHNYSNSPITPFSYLSKEGKSLTIKNKELEKIVYAHSDDLDRLNFADRIECPLQTDPNKFQRSECRAVTDASKNEALKRILELTTSTSSDFETRRFPMPYFPSEDALAYIDTDTKACVFFHANNNKLWSAKKLSELEMRVILNNPNFENLN